MSSDEEFSYQATPGALCCGLVQLLLPGPMAAAYCNGCGWAGPIRSDMHQASLDAIAHCQILESEGTNE